MNIKLLAKHHLEFLSIKGGCTGLSECIHVKTPHCWKSYIMAQIYLNSKSLQQLSVLCGNSVVLSSFCCYFHYVSGFEFGSFFGTLYILLCFFLVFKSLWRIEGWLIYFNCIWLLCVPLFVCVTMYSVFSC